MYDVDVCGMCAANNRAPEMLGDWDTGPDPTGHRVFENHSVGHQRLSYSPPAAPRSDFDEFFGMHPRPGPVARSSAVIRSNSGESPSSPCGYGPALVEANCPSDWGHVADLQEILNFLTQKKKIQA